MMKELVQNMGVINAAQLARRMAMTRLRGKDAEACVKTVGPSGIDTGVCGADVGIRRVQHEVMFDVFRG